MKVADQVNMTDVARAAGVSPATVSRALRNQPGVGPATRERIRRIAEEMSYVVSPEASLLARRKTGRVAVVVSRIDRWFYATVLAELERVFRAAGLDVLVYQLEGAEERRRFFDDLPARRKADALVIVALPVPDAEAARLERLGMQVVVAGGRVLDYPHVRIDDEEVGRLAVRHLAGLGHRRIAMIRTNDPEGAVWDSDLGRAAGYRQGLAEAGLPVDEELEVTVPFGVPGGARAMERLLSLPRHPTAVFCHSDEIALGALRTLRRAHVTVPGEVSVIGVDDQPSADLSDLTTVHQSVDEQARVAGEMVLALLRGEHPGVQHLVVRTRLVVRGTTGPPPPD
jgi:LacI family repressor for deo operon, udp, cdd, tsx, nupC, and nupG